MTDTTLVAPFHPPLLPLLKNRKVVLQVNDPAQVIEAGEAARHHCFDLACVWTRTNRQLSELAFDHEWGETPVALQAKGVGPFRDLARALEILAKFNLRLYLPAITREEMVGIRILSSLGFHCCATFDGIEEQEPDWEALCELAVYAMFSMVDHGEVDPFSYISRIYQGNGPFDPRGVYFSNPSRFVNVDGEGRLSVNGRGLSELIGLDWTVHHLEEALNSDTYLQAVSAWKEYFVERNRCAECEAWRVCMGVFSAFAGKGCRKLFVEVLQGAEHALKLREKKKEIWRP